MRNKPVKKFFGIILAIAFWLLVWEAASILISDNLKLFLPSPVSVIRKAVSLIGNGSYWLAVILTLLRIFTGFLTGIIGGISMGIITSHIKLLDTILSPAMRVIRAVPVVSFIILAYLFINVNYLPVFICYLMVMPLIWQTTHDELVGFDKDYEEMMRVFKITGAKKLFAVKFPTIYEKILSTMINGIGLAWKSGVATEVLCTPAVSLGRSLYRAKGNINYDEVYAITLTVVILSIVIEFAIKNFYRKNSGWEKKNDKI